MVTVTDVLVKHFGSDRVKYFQQSDALQSIEGDTYLRYQKDGGIQLWFGGNSGEVCVLITKEADVLEKAINLFIHGN